MPVNPILSKFKKPVFLVPSILLLFIFSIFYIQLTVNQSRTLSFSEDLAKIQKEKGEFEKELSVLKNQDEYKRNETLQKEIDDIQKTYKETVRLYEEIQNLRDLKKPTAALEIELAKSLHLLSERNYASAGAVLVSLNKTVVQLQQPTPTPPPAGGSTQTAGNSAPTSQNIPTNNTPPSSGHSRQSVNTEIGTYTIDIISADLNSTKVIVDTASDSDCRDNCPVLSLGDYVGRNGAFAGINGSYFCPASYPSCAGKTNSFDTLLMNKNKTYFNSDNNVYSNVPVAIFGSGYARFIGQSSGWGRDTGVDGVIANQPLLLSGGNIVFGGDGDPKKGSKGSRSFIGNRGNTVYIGVVHNVTVAEVAYVLKALGLEHALNLDSGGSTALWSGGYKAGPGRNIPNAILFVRR